MVVTSEDLRGVDSASGEGSFHSGRNSEGAHVIGEYVNGGSGTWSNGGVPKVVVELSCDGEKNGLGGSTGDIHDIGSAGDLTKEIMMDIEDERSPVSAEEAKVGGGGGEEHVDEAHLQAPDGGYGWFVVFASFLSHILIGGLERSDGIFFLQFQERYGQSAAITAWPGAAASMVRLGMGPIASAICQRWSVRSCVMVGGIAIGFIQILSALSPNFYFLFASHGILQGVARGLLYCPSLVIVTMYFDRRRGKATGLAASGVGVGTLLLVPLFQWLFDTFGFQGGFLVMSGICFNGILMAMMYRPLFLHYKFMGKKGETPEKPSPPDMVMLSEMSDAVDTVSVCSVRLRSNTSLNQSQNGKAGSELFRKLLSPDSASQVTPEARRQHNSSLHLAESDHNIVNTVKKDSWLKSSLKILFPSKPNRKRPDGKGEKTKLFHFELLGNLAFLSFCTSICLFSASFKSTFTFMPALAKAQGLTSSEGVFVLSVSGAVDTLGRIAAGFIMDNAWIKPRRMAIYCGVQLAVASLAALMPILGANFLWLCVISSLFGMMTGMLVSQKSVLVVDLLGVKLMPSAFGMLLLFQAVGVGIGPIVSGAFRDAFGRFHEAFYLGAGLMAFASCLMMLSTVLHKLDERRKEKPELSGSP